MLSMLSRGDEGRSGMDPVSLIVTALAMGVSTGVGEAAKDAVSRAYGRLKDALAERFGDDPAAEKTLERHASNPDGYEVPMRDVVTEFGAANDPVIVELARDLLAAADPAGAQVGKYNVQITSGAVGAIGDNATVTQTFGHPPTP
jgi:hypothetical protein